MTVRHNPYPANSEAVATALVLELDLEHQSVSPQPQLFVGSPRSFSVIKLPVSLPALPPVFFSGGFKKIFKM